MDITDSLMTAAHFHDLEKPQRNSDGDTMREAATAIHRLRAERDRLRQFVQYVCEEVSRIGCEGSGDEICVYAEIPKENWCPWCLLGEQVQAVQAI